MKRSLGLLVALAVIGAVIAFQMMSQKAAEHEADKAHITVWAGGEKMLFLQEFMVGGKLREYVEEKYNLVVERAVKKGSVAMVSDPSSVPPEVDAVWPANTSQVRMWKARNGKSLSANDVFYSFIVFYSWDYISEALVEHGLATKRSEGHYTIDVPKLVEKIEQGAKWTDLGLPDDFDRRIIVKSTDPAHSNSGNTFAGMLMTTWNNGEPPDRTRAKELLPKLFHYVDRMGFVETSSGTHFDQYVALPEGSSPLIVGYENQAVEYAFQHPGDFLAKRERMRILYPIPTVKANHPLIVRTEEGQRFAEVLADPRVQELAFSSFGFRPADRALMEGSDVFERVGLATGVIPEQGMPTWRVVQYFTQELQNR